MDKYLLVIMMFLIVSIPIAFVDPIRGEIKAEPNILLFYVSIAGICVIIVYSSYKERKQRHKDNLKRRSKK